MTRAAIYARVSTSEQATEGFSLSAQLDRLRLYAKAQSWTVAGEYVDEGHSGRTTTRPAYQKMLEESEAWDVVLVLKMDRAHRNSRNFMDFMADLEKQGKGFVSATESLDTTTAMGRFVMDVIQRIAQLESEQIGERVTVGMEQKAKTGGGGLGGPAPYGYVWNNGTLETVYEEAMTVRAMFIFAEKGLTPPTIAKRLNPKPDGQAWTRHSVRRILTNPVYAGCLRWNGILQCDQHEGIVSIYRFNAVQERISTNPRLIQ